MTVKEDIPSYQEEYVDEDKVLEFKGTAGQRYDQWGAFFNDKSVAHPAKMNLAMCEWIIDKYSKPGQIVMDMFGGTGSTGVMAIRKGRHAVICELEEPYIKDMIEPNIDEASMLTSLESEIGEARIIKCDSRELSEHVPEAVDSIITSPPYSGMEIKTKQDPEVMKLKFQKALAAKGKISKSAIGTEHAKMGRSMTSGSDYTDPDNIGLLDHGSVDAVITSPPYSDTSIIRYDSAGHTKFFQDQIDTKGYIEHDGKRYTEEEWRALNHGRIDGRSTPGVDYGERGYSVGEDNLGNLPHGDVDTVIASPPYGQMELSKKFKSEEEKLEYAKKLAAIDGRTVEAALANIERWQDYEASDGQIANMPHGEVDAIVSSPPYVPGTKSDREAYDEAKGMEQGKGSYRQQYSEDPKNIGNPRPMGDIDAVISSPPYSEALSTKAGGGSKDVLEGKGIKGRGKDGIPVPYSEDDDQIGNMSHGDIDAVISSPPYGAVLSEKSGGDDRPEKMREVLEGWGYSPKQIEKILSGETNIRAFVTRRGYNYSGNEDNIGNLPTGEIDSVISSPPYEGSLEDRGGTQDKFKEEKGVPAPYSKDPENIGNQTKETYLSAMLDVYRECFKVMKADGIMALVTKNFVRNKKPVRLDLDTIKLCEHAGFTLIDRWWFRLPMRSFWAIQHTRKFCKENPDAEYHPYAVYEDILVFQKVI